nr:hypothetical protein [Tanacetum cinerariifolium]
VWILDIQISWDNNLFATNHQSGKPIFSSHTDLTLPEVINLLSGSTTSYSSNHLLEEFADEFALITFPLGNDDFPFDIESDLREIEYLLNHDPTKEIDSILEDNLADPNDNLFYTTSEMIFPRLMLCLQPTTRTKYLIRVSSFMRTFLVTIQATTDKNVKKIAISHASLILEDFDPLLSDYELPFHKEVLESETLLSFSFENEEKVFKYGILTSKGVHSSLLLELSHRGSKAFKIIKNIESLTEIFPCSHGEDIHILDVTCLHFYPS